MASFYDLDKLVISHIKSFLDVDSYRNVLLTATLFHTRPNEALLELLEIQKEYATVRQIFEGDENEDTDPIVRRCYITGCNAYRITTPFKYDTTGVFKCEFIHYCDLCDIDICSKHYEGSCFNCSPVYKKHKKGITLKK